MLELQELKTRLRVRGLVAAGEVTIVAVEPHGDGIVNVVFGADDGHIADRSSPKRLRRLVRAHREPCCHPLRMAGWQDKWTGALSKLETCIAECRTNVRTSQKCKDSIEATMADLWHLKDWLGGDPAVLISRSEFNAFLETPGAFNIRGCGDLTTLDKHYVVKSRHREHTALEHENILEHTDGAPLVFSATRDYGDGNLDRWEDAVELAIRAAREWEAFLVDRKLLSKRRLTGSGNLSSAPADPRSGR